MPLISRFRIALIHLAAAMPVAWHSAPAAAQPVQHECTAQGSPAATRSCLQQQLDRSSAELGLARAEAERALSNWNENPRRVRRARKAMQASRQAFERFRHDHCAFKSSLISNGAAAEEEQLACVIALNRWNAEQLKATVALLEQKKP